MSGELGIRWVGRRELQSCPAAVEITGDEGVLLLNEAVFPWMPEYHRRFSVGHELGHYLLGTGDETVADAFALGLLHGTDRRSLKEAVRKLAVMGVPNNRVRSLYALCLEADKERKGIIIY